MSKGISRKQLKHDEFVEAAFSVEQWFEDNWQTIVKWAALVVVVAIVVAGWFWWSNRRAGQATDLMARGLAVYRTANSAAATPSTTTEASYGEAVALFEQAGSKAGGPLTEVAEYYRGSALLRAGKAGEAIPPLEAAARAAEPALAGAAKTRLADAYAREGRLDDAVAVLRELSRGGGYAENALLTLGLTLRNAGRDEEARQALEDLRERYPQSPLAQQAERLLQ